MAAAKAPDIDTLLKMLARERLDGLSVLEVGALDEAESRRLEALGASVVTYETDGRRVEAVRQAFPHRQVCHVDLSRPWLTTPPDGFDVVIAAGLLDDVDDWAPFLRFARQIAPVLYLDAGAPDTAEPITRLLEDMNYIVTPAGDGATATGLLLAQQRDANAAVFAPVLVHVHMLKCAGCSFRRILELSFGDRHFNMYDYDPASILEPDEMTRLLYAQPALASISSHAIRSFPPLLGSRIPLYVTFLRDPADQFLSYMKYVKKNWPTLGDDHRRRLPPDGDTMPTRDLARWLVTSGDEVMFNRDYTVRYMSEIVFYDELHQLARRLGDHAALTSTLGGLYRQVDVDLAISVLEDFFFVGIVEEMEASVALLREQLEAYGFELQTGDYRRENVSPKPPKDADWLNEDDDVGRLVLQSLQKDYRLYNHFKARSRKTRAATARPHLADERPRFERLAAAMPQYGVREKALREELGMRRSETRLLRTHLRNIFTSRSMRLLWKTGIVKKPPWVDGFLRELEQETIKRDDSHGADESTVRET